MSVRDDGWIAECLRHEECWVETEMHEDGRVVRYCMCDDDWG